ncbi:hypothetical protein S40293_11618, partial [Stachybotrys chartarum IBT 40293]
MASSISSSIPVRVFLAMLQEYDAYLCQWQAHAEAQDREAQSLRDRISVLEKEKEDLKACQDVLQRMVDIQQELVASLDADLTRANKERQDLRCVCKSNGLTSCATFSPMPELGPADTNTHNTIAPLPPLDPNEQHKRVADIDVGSSPKRIHREESGGIGLRRL